VKYCDTCHSAYPDDFTICPRDQGALRQAADLVPGMVIRGKYEVLSKVGSGGMASVYKARHVAFGEVVALKLVGTRLAGDTDFLKRFRNEAVITRRLQHPNAVRVEDLDATEDGRPFIVMEYVDGRSLRELVRSDGPQPLARAVSVARQVCSALAAAHALGITHRDIKPDNILLGRGPDGAEHVKVLDFGIAKVREASEGGGGEGYTPTRTGMIVGTPQYISPEQAMGKRGDEVDGRADLYSLGVVLYEMVTGKLPFHSDTAMGMLLHHLQTAPTPPNLARPDLDIPAPLTDVLMRALQKDREQRYASASEMLAALDRVAALPLPEAPPLVWPAVPVITPPPVRTPSGAPTPRPLTPTELAQIEAQPTKMMPSTPTPAPTMMQGTPTLMQPPGPRRRPWWQWVAAAGVIVFAMCSGLCARACSDHDDRRAAPTPAAADTGKEPSAAELVREGVKEAMREVDDDTIKDAVEERLENSKATAEHDLSVRVEDGVVTLGGEVPSGTVSQVAQALAETVAGVKEVHNQIRAPKDASAPRARAQPNVAPPPGQVRPVPPVPPTRGLDPVDPKSPEGQALQELLKRGREALEAHRPDVAMRHYGSALSLDPTNQEAKEGMEKAATAMAGDWTKGLPFRFGPQSHPPRPPSVPPPAAPPSPTPEP
jgi:serine/threonine protein kinase